MSMPKTSVRIAMLGSGFVAGFYMQGLANVGSQEVVANYSKKKHRARKFAQQWSIPEPTAELNKLIERDDIDLYVIAVPNEEHLPVSLALNERFLAFNRVYFHSPRVLVFLTICISRHCQRPHTPVTTTLSTSVPVDGQSR